MITAELASEKVHPPVSPIAGSLEGAAPRFAYLLSQYPARSHTFFLNEVLGLRARGLGIEVASINTPDRPLGELPQEEAAEARSTFYIKQTAGLSAMFSLLSTVLTRPAVLARGSPLHRALTT